MAPAALKSSTQSLITEHLMNFKANFAMQKSFSSNSFLVGSKFQKKKRVHGFAGICIGKPPVPLRKLAQGEFGLQDEEIHEKALQSLYKVSDHKSLISFTDQTTLVEVRNTTAKIDEQQFRLRVFSDSVAIVDRKEKETSLSMILRDGSSVEGQFSLQNEELHH